MKNIILMFIISMMVTNCIPPGTSILQNSDLKMPFNMEEFDKRFNFANDLAQDDMVAWRTTDSITAQKPVLLDSLDKTWFVYEDNSKRYAFYGRYHEDTKEYVSKYSFMVNKKGTVNQIANDVNVTTRKYAEAIATGKKKLRQILDSLKLNVKYNHYIKKSENDTYKMWFFPAGYGNYCAYGLDVYLTIDSSRAVITDSKIIGNGLRFFEFKKKPSKIELDNTYESMPSLGNLFFMIMNRKYFKSIIIRNQNSISSMIFSPKSKEWIWIHSVH